MSPKSSERLGEQLREMIEESIVTGETRPGTRLDEIELAARYGVSRTPVREALIALATAGVIDKRPRKGWEVAEMSPSRLLEMFDVMAELESMCARLAARRATEGEIRKIEKAHLGCGGAMERNDPTEYFKFNDAFHGAIFAASHNGFLSETTSSLYKRLRPYRRLQLRLRNRMTSSFAEHGAVLEAIMAGDDTAAADSLRSHVTVLGDRFTDMVAQFSELTHTR